VKNQSIIAFRTSTPLPMIDFDKKLLFNGIAIAAMIIESLCSTLSFLCGRQSNKDKKLKLLLRYN